MFLIALIYIDASSSQGISITFTTFKTFYLQLNAVMSNLFICSRTLKVSIKITALLKLRKLLIELHLILNFSQR